MKTTIRTLLPFDKVFTIAIKQFVMFCTYWLFIVYISPLEISSICLQETIIFWGGEIS